MSVDGMDSTDMVSVEMLQTATLTLAGDLVANLSSFCRSIVRHNIDI